MERYHRDLQWRSGEHLYQAAKFTNEDVIERIHQAATPKDAKLVAYQNSEHFASDCDSVKLAVMAEVIAAKIANWYGTALDLFERSGNRRFVEISHRDDFWGAKPDLARRGYVGSNVLGQLWSGYKRAWREGNSSLTGPTPTGRLPTTSNIDQFLVVT